MRARSVPGGTGVHSKGGLTDVVAVAGPVIYTVWRRKRPLADLGITRERLPETLALGALFAVTQFVITLWGYDLPADAEDWVPLLVMSMTVGIFEAIFFRGIVQTRLEASTGALPGLALAAALYGLYHVGYGMGFGDMTPATTGARPGPSCPRRVTPRPSPGILLNFTFDRDLGDVESAWYQLYQNGRLVGQIKAEEYDGTVGRPTRARAV